MKSCKTEDLSQSLPDRIDYFLVCASYEDRCLTSYNYIDSMKVKSAAVFYYEQFYENVIDNADLLVEKFKAKKYILDNYKPTTIADAVVNYFSIESDFVEEKPNVVVDVSTFTRESLLILLRYLQINKDSFKDIVIYYRSADVSHNLSDAVLSIRSVIGYMGDIDPEKPTHLIVLSGYEYERAKEIIDVVEPDYISIGYGGKGESINDDIQEKNKIFTNKLIAYYSSDNIEKFTHSLVDINVLKNKLIEIIFSKEGYNVVIAPLNNKISTISAGLAASENPKVQICYAQMANYNVVDYSTALDTCFVEKLEFN